MSKIGTSNKKKYMEMCLTYVIVKEIVTVLKYKVYSYDIFLVLFSTILWIY